MGLFIELLCALRLCSAMRKGGSTLSRHSTELWDSLESSDHRPGTAPRSVLQKHPSQGSLPWVVLDVDGFPKASGGELVTPLICGLRRRVLGLQSSAAEPGWPQTLSFESLFCL